MKTETIICDNCKKAVSKLKCDICDCDLCDGCLNRVDIYAVNNAKITIINLCSKCKRNVYWEGELAPDLKALILERMKARIMLNSVEKQ